MAETNHERLQKPIDRVYDFSPIADFQPTVIASKGKGRDALTNAIHENDVEVAAKIRKQAQLGELTSQVRVIEGYYNLDTGKVEWTAK